jgi:hypothetical protein
MPTLDLVIVHRVDTRTEPREVGSVAFGRFLDRVLRAAP